MIHVDAEDEFSLPHNYVPDQYFAVDPGKRDLILMTDLFGNTLKYTYGRRQKDSGAERFRKKNIRKRFPLLRYETETLSTFNSSTCNLQRFQQYVNAKLHLEDVFRQLYSDPSFRKDRWSREIGRQSSDDRFVSRLTSFVNQSMNVYGGRRPVIFYGNWGAHPNLPHSKPTPGIGSQSNSENHS
jgi:hypothetical protein